MRLIQLKVRNFRGFGNREQSIDLDGDLVILYGPNGQGKTSFSEAIEWLLYGSTKRRQRGEDYSKSEYANSFANVHGYEPTEVSLTARIGKEQYTLKRVLDAKEASRTFIDGTPGEFQTLGVSPLEVFYPVIAQHELQSFIHAKPKERRDAICAALGLDELTELKSSLESARASLQRNPPRAITEAIDKLSAIAESLRRLTINAEITELAKRWLAQPPKVDASGDAETLLSAARILLKDTSVLADNVLSELRSHRSKLSAHLFNLQLVQLRPDHARLKDSSSAALDALADELQKLSDSASTYAALAAAEYSQKLLDFWKAGLLLVPEPSTCPMCEEETLTEQKRQQLAQRIRKSAAHVEAEGLLKDAARRCKGQLSSAVDSVDALGVSELTADDTCRLIPLIEEHEDYEQYLNCQSQLSGATGKLRTAFREIANIVDPLLSGAISSDDLPKVITTVHRMRDNAQRLNSSFTTLLSQYEVHWNSISGVLNEHIAANRDVAAVDAVGKALSSGALISTLQRYQNILDDTQNLIRQVETTLKSKQEAMLASRGEEVRDLYNLLNSNSEVGFDAMEPATDAVRLHAKSFGVRMSAAANLSECQLNCLGLAMWLVRANTPSSPFQFVVLDDPVQSMDDDHVETFVSNVVPYMLDERKKQVVVLSHVKGVIERLRQLNLHRNVRHYHYDNYSADGPEITKQHKLRQLLSDITSAAGGNESNREYAVDRLRVLVELFIRELHLKQTGSPTPSSYDSANPSQLLELFRKIPNTDPTEYPRLRDTVHFCDPSHHTQTNYSVPLRSNIQPHIDRMQAMLKKYSLI